MNLSPQAHIYWCMERCITHQNELFISKQLSRFSFCSHKYTSQPLKWCHIISIKVAAGHDEAASLRWVHLRWWTIPDRYCFPIFTSFFPQISSSLPPFSSFVVLSCPQYMNVLRLCSSAYFYCKLMSAKQEIITHMKPPQKNRIRSLWRLFCSLPKLLLRCIPVG